MRFMHVADIHLGYQQYNCKERFNDFSRAFLHIVDQACVQQVDFLLLAGDLFEKRTIDPLGMRVAMEGLHTLRDAGIPVVAVEGNHERAYYRDQYSWVAFLDALGYLCLLNPRFEDGHAVLKAHGDEGGAYLDLPCGARVYGLKYHGASTSQVFGMFADAVADENHSGFNILLAHAGLEGQIPHYSGTLTYNDLAPLRDHIDYVALGHIHKPYAVEDWIYNPGSPETWSIEEADWPDRGYYLVEVKRNPGHHAELIPVPRRPFHRWRLPVDVLDEPNAVYDAVRALLRRKKQELDRDSLPVVELTLHGVLAFSRFDLDLGYIEGMIKDEIPVLLVRVRNMTIPAEFEINVDVEASRPELERAIVRDLLERDARYRASAGDWTRVALEIKHLALDKSSPESVIEYLQHARTELFAGKDGGD